MQIKQVSGRYTNELQYAARNALYTFNIAVMDACLGVHINTDNLQKNKCRLVQSFFSKASLLSKWLLAAMWLLIKGYWPLPLFVQINCILKIFR